MQKFKAWARAHGIAKWKVKAWLADVIVSFAASPVVPSNLRLSILRKVGWKIGKNTSIEHFFFASSTNIVIGNNCHVGRYAFFDSHGGIEIEDSVRIGSHSKILTRTHPISPGPIRQITGEGYDVDEAVRIGYGSWLATGVTILPGAHVANGCVIGTGAVVAKPTLPNKVYMGVPAVAIKDLI